jgi:hypothetical protein
LLFLYLDIGNYDNQQRLQRQRSPDRANGYMSPPLTSSSPTLYQQNYALSRSVTLPEPEHNSRRSNSYNVPSRHTNNDDDMQHDGKTIPHYFNFTIYSTVIQIVIRVVIVDQALKQLGMID